MSQSRTDTFDATKLYRRFIFHEDRDLCDFELTELEDTVFYAIKSLFDSIYSNGAILSGAAGTVNVNEVTVADGTMYLNGFVTPVFDTTLTFDPDKVTGMDYVYVEALRAVITAVEDNSLTQPYTDEPVSEREKWVVSLRATNTDGTPLPVGYFGRYVTRLYDFDRATGILTPSVPSVSLADLSAHIGAGGIAHALAIAGGAAGFMSGVDKLKLDGLDGASYAPAGHVGAGGIAHALATIAVAGFMSSTDKVKLNGLNAANYAPIAHVGAGGAAHALATDIIAGFMSAVDKAKIDTVDAGAGVPRLPATLTVAAADSVAASRVHADYICDGTDDHLTIAQAIAALPELDLFRARLATDFAAPSGNLLFEATATGAGGNALSVEFVNAGAGQTLLITRVANKFTVRLATSGGGAITTTGGDVVTAFTTFADDDITVALAMGDGTGLVSAFAEASLSGGFTGKAGRILLSEGTFVCADAIEVPSYVEIVGMGDSTVLKIADYSGSSMYLFTVQELCGVRFANLRFDLNIYQQSPATYQGGIAFSGSVDCSVDNCTFYGASNAGGYAAIFMGQGNGDLVCVRNRVTDCIFTDCATGIKLVHSKDCLISGCQFVGGVQHIETLVATYCTISGCVSRGSIESPLHIWGSMNCMIANNAVIGGGQFADNTYPAIYIDGDGGNLSSYNMIVGNIVRHGGGARQFLDAIHMSASATLNTITGNDCVQSQACRNATAINNASGDNVLSANRV